MCQSCICSTKLRCSVHKFSLHVSSLAIYLCCHMICEPADQSWLLPTPKRPNLVPNLLQELQSSWITFKIISILVSFLSYSESSTFLKRKAKGNQLSKIFLRYKSHHTESLYKFGTGCADSSISLCLQHSLEIITESFDVIRNFNMITINGTR